MLALTGVLAVAGCSENGATVRWETTVPGVYEGSESGFRETVDFRTNGEFRHEVFIDERSVLAESGKWSFDNETGAVSVEPFTSFFDRFSRKTVRLGVKHTSDALFVMRYGSAANTISPSVDFEFCLIRKKATVPNEQEGRQTSGSVTNITPPTNAPR